jgi:hypothetical protein
MRKLISFFPALFLLPLLAGCGQEAAMEDTPWPSYGGEFTLAEAVPLSQAIAGLGEEEEATVLVEGTIEQVCQSKGCWMVVRDGDAEARIRFKDYAFFIPWESHGKRVKMEGALRWDVASEETARHWAEEAGDPDLNPQDIHGDQPYVLLMASAVSIEGGTEITAEQRAAIGGETATEHDQGEEHDHDHGESDHDHDQGEEHQH